MTGLDGINALEKALGTLGVQESRVAETPRSSRTAAAQSVSEQTDHTNLSSAGGLVAQLASSPDVRADKVASLQAAIASGGYKVPASAVADKLITHLLNQ